MLIDFPVDLRKVEAEDRAGRAGKATTGCERQSPSAVSESTGEISRAGAEERFNALLPRSSALLKQPLD
jgi:hypothetical protein